MGDSVVKNLPANARDASLIPGSGRSPGEGNGNPLQYSCLENSMDRGAWRATVHRIQEVKHDCETEHTHTQTHTHTHTHGLYWLISLSSHHFLEAFCWWAYSIGGPSSSDRVQPPAAVKQVFRQPANIQSIQTVSWFFVLLKIIKPFVSNQKAPG